MDVCALQSSIDICQVLGATTQNPREPKPMVWQAKWWPAQWKLQEQSRWPSTPFLTHHITRSTSLKRSYLNLQVLESRFRPFALRSCLPGGRLSRSGGFRQDGERGLLAVDFRAMLKIGHPAPKGGCAPTASRGPTSGPVLVLQHPPPPPLSTMGVCPARGGSQGGQSDHICTTLRLVF